MKRCRAFRPQCVAFEARIVLSDVAPTPVPLLPAPTNPGIVSTPLLTAPCAPLPGAPSPSPTVPALCTVSVGGNTYRVLGMTDGNGVIVNTTSMPAGTGTVTISLPDGTSATYNCTINGTDTLQRIQAEKDADGQSYMTFPARCTVPAIYPADLGLSA